MIYITDEEFDNIYNDAKAGHGISEVKIFEAGNNAVFKNVINISSSLKFVSRVLSVLVSSFTVNKMTWFKTGISSWIIHTQNKKTRTSIFPVQCLSASKMQLKAFLRVYTLRSRRWLGWKTCTINYNLMIMFYAYLLVIRIINTHKTSTKTVILLLLSCHFEPFFLFDIFWYCRGDYVA